MYRLLFLALVTLSFSQITYGQDKYPESKETTIENANILCENKDGFFALSERDQRIWFSKEGPYQPGQKGYEAQNVWVKSNEYTSDVEIYGEYVFYIMGPASPGNVDTVLGDVKYAPEATTLFIVTRSTDSATVIKATSFTLKCRKI